MENTDSKSQRKNKKKDFTPMYLNMKPIIAKMNLEITGHFHPNE